MKESSGKTKKLSKGVRRARSMRNMVMMVLVCVLMLSAATYAWFSLSTAAKVANLTMTVGEDTSLLIAPDLARGNTTGQAGLYGSSLEFGESFAIKDANNQEQTNQPSYEIDAALLPATVTADGTVYKPDYDDNDGTIIEDFVPTTEFLTDGEVADGENRGESYYCYKTSFYLKTAGQENAEVTLKSPEALISPSTLSSGTEPTSGTYITNNSAQGKNNKGGAAAIRIRLYTVGTNDVKEEIIFEPLHGVTFTNPTDFATLKSGLSNPAALTPTDSQADNAVFTPTGKLTVSPDGTRVYMEVWVEGTDNECVNQIMGSDIVGNLVFTVDETATN